MTLRMRLNLVVAGLSAAFVAVLLAAEVKSARASIREEITAANRVAAQLLGQLASLERHGAGPELVLEFLDALGRVRAHDITLVSPAGDVLYRSPASTWKAGRDAPGWFDRLLAPAEFRQRFELPDGSMLLLEADASRAVLDAWDAFVWLVAVAAVMLAGVHGAAFRSVGRAFRPVLVRVLGMPRIRAGHPGSRLPRLDGAVARLSGDALNATAAAVVH